MAKLPLSTITDQVAAHLRERILEGRWQDFLPGWDRLAAELGVNHMTALKSLKRQMWRPLTHG